MSCGGVEQRLKRARAPMRANKIKMANYQMSVWSIVAACVLIASFNCNLCKASNLYESQIIGLTFPSAEALQARTVQQQQQQQQQQRYQQQQRQQQLLRYHVPASIYEQLRLASAQPRVDTNVKRTILWKGECVCVFFLPTTET